MKFWILATLMLKGSHVTILVKFDQILSQILVKLGQILVKIFKIQKSDIFRIQMCCIPNFGKYDPLDQILMLAKFQNLIQLVKFWTSWNWSFLEPKHNLNITFSVGLNLLTSSAERWMFVEVIWEGCLDWLVKVSSNWHLRMAGCARRRKLQWYCFGYRRIGALAYTLITSKTK